MTTVAVIGLGNMGGPMAAHLVKSGHSVFGVDPSPHAASAAAEAGVTVVDDVDQAVAAAGAVVTMLPDGSVVEEVLTGERGALAQLQPGSLVIDSSTIDLPTARRMHEAAEDAGHFYLDAPVSGGATGAQNGSLTFMAGGRAEVVEKARPLLEAMGSRVVHAGGAGAGAAAKIVNNMLLGISLAGVCEAFVLAERLGLEHQVFYDITSTSSGDCWALRTWTPVPGIVEGTPSANGWQPGFSTSLMLKDLRLAGSAAQETAAHLSMADNARSLFQQLAESGSADLDCSSLIEMVRRPGQ